MKYTVYFEHNGITVPLTYSADYPPSEGIPVNQAVRMALTIENIDKYEREHGKLPATEEATIGNDSPER